jgi:hypothetical protein
VQVRTPEFKEWFGDWQAAHGVQKLGDMKPANLDNVKPAADQKAVEALFKGFGEVENLEDGRAITFPVSMAGKILRHKGFDMKRIAGALDRLFAGAVPMNSEIEEAREGRKDHTSNTYAYHDYVTKFEHGGKTYYIRFTAQQMKARGDKPGESLAHSAFVSDVSIYQANEKGGVLIQPASGLLTRAHSDASPSDTKLAQWMKKGKSPVSTNIDPETGEPTADVLASDDAPRFSVASGKKPSAWTVDAPASAVAQAFDNVRYQFQDKYIDLDRIIRAIKKAGGTVRDHFNAYIAETLMHGRIANSTKRFHEDELTPILEDMKKSGIDIRDMEEFLHARHAKERNREMAKLHPTQAEIDARLAQLAQQIQDISTRGSAAEKKLLPGLNEEQARLHNTPAWTGTLEDRNRLSGMSDKEADDIIDAVKKRKGALNYGRIADNIDRMIAVTRAGMQAYGLETADTINNLSTTYRHYVPLMRNMDESDLLGGGMRGGGRGSMLKSATGSLREVENIFANIVWQREELIARGEKNRVKQSLLGLVTENPNAGFWSVINPRMSVQSIRAELLKQGSDAQMVNDMVGTMTTTTVDRVTGIARTRLNPLLANLENVISARVNGEERLIVLSRKHDATVRLAQTMRNEERAWFPSGKALGTIGAITRYIAAMATQYNPVFGFTNFTRDVQEAMLNLANTEIAGRQKEVAKGVRAALKAIWGTERGKNPTGKWAGYYQEFLSAGAATGYRDGYANVEDRARAIERELYGVGVKDIRSADDAAFALRNAKVVKPVFDFLSHFNTTIENATRLSAYVAARESGLTSSRAAEIAKGLTVNFNRKGASSGAMSSLYAFFNAAAQGTTRMLQTLNSPAGKKIIYGGITLGTLQVALGVLMMGDDEWENIPEFEKAKNLILPIPNGGKSYTKIPMPLGFNVLPNIGRSVAEMAWRHDRLPERAANLLVAVLDSFNPLGSGNAMSVITPSAMDAAVEVYSNRDAFGRQISREDFSSLDPTPGHSRARESTSAIWVAIAKAINYGTGGNQDKPGVFSPTPEAISYLFGAALGGVGREADKLWSFGENMASDEKTPPYRIPMLSRFYGEAGGEFALRSKYYSAIKDINIAENQLKGAMSRGEEPDASIIKVGSLAKSSRALQQRITKLQKIRIAASAEDKREIDASIIETQGMLVQMWRASTV